MRKVLLFFISVAMIAGGLYFLWAELQWMQHHSMRLLIVIGTSMLAVLGAYLLWADFIAPLFGIKEGE